MFVLKLVVCFVMLGVERANAEYFIWAAHDGDVNYVTKVIADGNIDLNMKNEGTGTTALMFASKENRPQIVELLLNAGASTNLTDKWGNTALSEAIYKNNYQVIKLLLDGGASIDRQDKWGTTALMKACESNSLDVIELLLEYGAAVDIRDNNTGRTALYGAVDENNIEAVKLLLNAGATVDLGSDSGRTGLMKASRENRLEIVKLLLEAGASVNQEDVKGWTALHYSAFGDKFNATQELLKNGASTLKLGTLTGYYGQDRDEYTPAELARFFGFNKVAELIEGYTSSTPSALSHLALLIQVINREGFLTGSLMMLAEL